MTALVQHKTPEQQFNSICHFALIKILVVHQLGLQGITWDDFISRDFFKASQGPSEAGHETSGPSHQHEGHDPHTATIPVFITYQKGTRQLFAAAKRVLSPPRVEGALFPTSVPQVQDRGKRPMQDEGPSGEQDFILVQDDDTDMGQQNAHLREIIQEQQTEIKALSLNMERAKWTMKYLEQRNK